MPATKQRPGPRRGGPSRDSLVFLKGRQEEKTSRQRHLEMNGDEAGPITLRAGWSVWPSVIWSHNHSEVDSPDDGGEEEDTIQESLMLGSKRREGRTLRAAPWISFDSVPAFGKGSRSSSRCRHKKCRTARRLRRKGDRPFGMQKGVKCSDEFAFDS